MRISGDRMHARSRSATATGIISQADEIGKRDLAERVAAERERDVLRDVTCRREAQPVTEPHHEHRHLAVELPLRPAGRASEVRQPRRRSPPRDAHSRSSTMLDRAVRPVDEHEVESSGDDLLDRGIGQQQLDRPEPDRPCHHPLGRRRSLRRTTTGVVRLPCRSASISSNWRRSTASASASFASRGNGARPPRLLARWTRVRARPAPHTVRRVHEQRASTLTVSPTSASWRSFESGDRLTSASHQRHAHCATAISVAPGPETPRPSRQAGRATLGAKNTSSVRRKSSISCTP